MPLYIYTYGDTGITEIDSATGSIYSGDPGVDRHHLIKRNIHSTFPSLWSHALMPSFRTSTHFVWFIHHGRVSLWMHSPSSNAPRARTALSRVPFRYYARCGGVLMMGCQPDSSTVSPHRDRENIEIPSEVVIYRVWRCTWRPRSSKFGDALECCKGANLEALFMRV
jgi:hypothetical protein